MSDEETQEEEGWWDSVTDTVSDAYDSASEAAGDAYDAAADTASDAAEWVGDTASETHDWAADTASDAQEWVSETADATGEWASETTDGWFGEGEEAAAGDAPITVPYEEPTEEQKAYWDEQARLSEMINVNRDSLASSLTSARGSADVLAGTWPEVDTDAAGALSGTLGSIAAEAGAAGDQLGVESYACQAFYGVRDEASWASQRAAIVADPINSDQWHAILAELPELIDGAAAKLSGI